MGGGDGGDEREDGDGGASTTTVTLSPPFSRLKLLAHLALGIQTLDSDPSPLVRFKFLLFFVIGASGALAIFLEISWMSSRVSVIDSTPLPLIAQNIKNLKK